MLKSIMGRRLLLQLDPGTEPTGGQPAPAPAAPAAEPNPNPDAEPPEPAPDVEPAPAEPEPDPLLDIINRTLEGTTDEPEPEVAPAPEPETAAPAAAEPEPTPAAPAADATPPPAAPRKKAVKSIAKDNPLVQPPEIPEYTPTTPTTQPSPAPAASEYQFNDDQQEQIADAVVAERLFPEKYKGLANRLRKWFSEFEARADALRAKNPNLTVDDDEYQALLQSKPVISQEDYRKVVRAAASDDAVAKAEQRMAPKFDQIEMNARRAEVMPAVQQFANETFPQGVRDLISADESSVLNAPLKAALEKGRDEAKSEFQLEFQVMSEVTKRSQERVRDFLLMVQKAIRPDNANPLHREIFDIITKEGEHFAQVGGKHLMRNGRRFMPRERFISMLGQDKSEAASFDSKTWTTGKYWTFSNDTIVDIMAQRAKMEGESLIKTELERLKSLGYVRPPKQPVAQQQPPVKEIQPPKARPGASPGLANQPKIETTDASPIPVSAILDSLKTVKSG